MSTVAERLDMIAALPEPASLLFDGCHKLYVLKGAAELAVAIKEWGYDPEDVFPVTKIHELWERSCDLRFVHAFDLTEVPYDIPQGAEEDEEEA